LNEELIADGSTNTKTITSSVKTTQDNDSNQGGDTVINHYTTLDGKVIAKSTSRVQAQNNRGKARALGVVTA
jgi:hypothetical protein